MSDSMIPADWGPVHPFQPRERESRVAKAKETQTIEVTGMFTANDAVNSTELLRWDATLLAAESALAEMTKQRDALKAELAEVSADRDSWRHCAQNS